MRAADAVLRPALLAENCAGEARQVDAEHARNAQSDVHREYQLGRRAAAVTHPYNRFGTGSLRTLLQVVDGEEGTTQAPSEAVDNRGEDEPAALTVTAREEALGKALREFHDTHYNPGHMTVIVADKRSLDELEDIVCRAFGDAPRLDEQKCAPLEARYGGVDAAFGAAEVGRVYRLTSVKREHVVKIVFPLPAISRQHREMKPSSLFSHLIGHESEGSLLSLLKKLKLADGLSAGGGSLLTCFELFSVNIKLTEAGFAAWERVVELLFAYIAMLDRVHTTAGSDLKRIWDEQKIISDAQFRFLEMPSSLFSAVQRLAGVCYLYEPHELVAGPYSRSVFNPDMITTVLQHLRPDNCQVFLRSESFSADSNWIVDPDYPTRYCFENLDSAAVAKFKAARSSVEPRDLAPMLSLPSPNPFLCTDFSLCGGPEKTMDHPELIASSAEQGYRFWHCLDTSFEVPRAAVEFRLFSPLLMHADQWVLFSVFSELFMEAAGTMHLLYHASLAECIFGIHKFSTCISLSFDGFSQNLHSLVALVLSRMVDLCLGNSEAGAESSDMLERILTKVTRRYKNVAFEQAYNQAGNRLQQLLLEGTLSNAEKLHFAELLSQRHGVWKEEGERGVSPVLASVMEVARTILGTAFLEGLAHGNISERDSRNMHERVYAELSRIRGQTGRSPGRYHVQRCGSLSLHSKGHAVSAIPQSDPDSKNCCVYMFWDCGPDYTFGSRNRVLQDVTAAVFDQLTDHFFFDRLRTEDKLGYIVWSGFRRLGDSGSRGYRILVQSSKFSVDHVEDRVFASLAKCRDMVAAVTPNDLEATLNAVIQRKKMKETRLSERSSRFGGELWGSRTREELVWDRRELEIGVLQESLEALGNGGHGPVSATSLLKFFDAVFGPDSSSLGIHVYVGDSSSSKGTITDASEFFQSLPLLPAPLLQESSQL